MGLWNVSTKSVALIASFVLGAELVIAQPVSRDDDPVIDAGKIERQLKAVSRSVSPNARGLVLKAVTFKFNSSDLTDTARLQLDQLSIALSSNDLSEFDLKIAGHTDSVGPAAVNLELSQQRAASVRTYLVDESGISDDRITSSGYGETKLIPDLDPEDPEHRRVEFKIVE